MDLASSWISTLRNCPRFRMLRLTLVNECDVLLPVNRIREATEQEV